MSDLKKCWNCGELYDIDEFDRCPECFEYWDDDPEICSDDYEEDYEEDMFNNNDNLNNTTMNLQTLREAKREYKGLKSVTAYMQENFKDLESQFTVDLMNEAISEYRNKGNKEVVVVYDKRLFRCSKWYSYAVEGVEYTGKPNVFSDFFVYCHLGGCIDDNLSNKPYGRVKIGVDDVYFVEDNTEIYKLEIQAKEQDKQRLLENHASELAASEASIAEDKQYIEDIKKYGTEDKVKIKQLKAVEVIRNSKATDNEVLEAIKVITW